VDEPTVGLFGEAGPEAVVPLAQWAPGDMARRSITVEVYLDGRVIGRVAAQHLPEVLAVYGVGA
jgi:hypothetical protein